MLNLELAVLQTLEQEKWATLSEISAKTRIQEQTAEQMLRELNRNGMVESRPSVRAGITQWRGRSDSIESYLQDKVPA